MTRERSFAAVLADRLYRCLNVIGIHGAVYYLVREDIDAEPPRDPRVDRGEFTVCFLGEDDMASIGRHPDREQPWLTETAMRESLRKGNPCIGIKHNGEIAAFTWFNCGEITYPPERRRLEADEAYLFDLYTLKQYRGMGLAPIVRAEAYRAIRAQGRTRVYSVSEFFNHASIRVKKKLNATFVHLGICVSLFNERYRWKWTLKTRACSQRPSRV